jgi:hypothetical protein
MRFVFLLGGISGFGLAGGASYFAGHGADRVFLDAAVGCLCGAVLFRWFWRILIRGFRETIVQRQAAKPATGPATPAFAAAPIPQRAK